MIVNMKRGQSKENRDFTALLMWYVLILTFAIGAIMLRLVNIVHKYVLRLMKSYTHFKHFKTM